LIQLAVASVWQRHFLPISLPGMIRRHGARPTRRGRRGCPVHPLRPRGSGCPPPGRPCPGGCSPGQPTAAPHASTRAPATFSLCSSLARTVPTQTPYSVLLYTQARSLLEPILLLSHQYALAPG